MRALKREDDFRSHDPFLVKVLRGREFEAVDFALSLSQEGYPVGLLVQGDEVDEWDFLQRASELRRFEFVNFSGSLRGSNLASIRGARFLRIVGRKIAVDFSDFQSLEVLHYQWSRECSGIEHANRLMEAHFYELGASGNSKTLSLPARLEFLSLFNFHHDEIAFLHPMDDLSELVVERARNLRRLPPLDGLRRLEMKNCGRDRFDYSSIGSGVESVEIDACAPISSWNFVGSPSLKRLVIWNNRIPPIDAATAEVLARLQVVDFHANNVVDS